MKQRIAYWDNLKYLMILFVVVGHFILENNSGISSPFYNSLSAFIYLFHIPVFFFISGYFFKKQSALWNALTYVLYALATKLVMFFGKWIAYMLAIKVFGKSAEYVPVKFSLIKYSDIVWFLVVLAFAEIIMFALDKFNAKALLVIAIIVGCSIGYFSFIGGTSLVGDYFAWFRTLIMVPFFVFGRVIQDVDILDELRKRKRIRILGAVVIVAVLIAFILNPQNISSLINSMTGRNSYEILSKAWISSVISPAIICKFGAIIRLLLYICSFIMIMSWTVVIPNINIPFITKCGSKTILIFMFHYLGLYFVNAMGWSKMITTTAGKISFILIAIIWALILSLVFYKVPDVIKLGIKKLRTKKR